MRHKASQNTLAKQIGENVARWRVIRGMSQRTLGESCPMSVTAQQISKFEAGTNFISSPQLVAFAKALDVPVATLISGVENFLPDGERVTQKDGVMMHNYKTLSPKLQAAFKTLIDSMAIELANNKRSVPNE